MTDVKQPSGLAVALCGMPSSGNRLLRGMLRHHGILAEVKHWGEFEDLAMGWQRDGLTVAAVMPVRDEAISRASCARFWTAEQSHDEEQRRHYAETLRVCAELRIPLLPVSYGQIVRNPNGIGRHILTWLGQPFVGWNTVVVDGDAKYHAQLSGEEQDAESRAKQIVYAPDKSKEIIAPISASLKGTSRAFLR